MATYDDKTYAEIHVLEGDLAEIPGDPGGITNRGISLAWAREIGLDLDHDGDVDADDIRAIDDATARQVYLRERWQKRRYAELNDQNLAVAVFTMDILAGERAAVRALQRALRANLCPGIVDDGALGPKSIAAANGCEPLALRAAFRSEHAAYLRLTDAAQKAWAAAHGVARAEVLPGWLNRAYRP